MDDLDQITKAVEDDLNNKVFDTGAVRSNELADVDYTLIPPFGLRAVAQTCSEGAKKYDAYNWERGMPARDLLNHALAHIYKFLAGDRGEPHLGHAGWNVLAAIDSLHRWPELNKGTLRNEGCAPPVVVPQATVDEINEAFSECDAYYGPPLKKSRVKPGGIVQRLRREKLDELIEKIRRS